MKSRILISLSLLWLLGGQKAGAQVAPPDDFFNSGAQLYISNNIPAALQSVEEGLKAYPGDSKLKRLEELLKQQQQNQQQQQDQQNQQQQKNQQQNQQNEKSSSQKSQEQQKKQEEQQKQSEQKKEQPPPKDDSQASAGDKQKQPPTEGEPAKAGQMTPEEAKRLLDEQKDNEQLLRLKPEDKPRNPMHTVKDW